MPKVAIPAPYMAAAAIVAIAVAYVVLRGAAKAGAEVGRATVDFADGVITGGVVGVGEAVGVPATNETDCQKAKREGRTWDASFACPAGDFLKYVFS